MSTATYRNEEMTYFWQLICPPKSIPVGRECLEQSASILAEISEFRGRTLYAEGRRPRFVREDGYADDDPIDVHSFHVTVRADGELVGCMRVTPMRELSRSFLGRLAGTLPLQEALQTMKVKAGECVEAGRWIVAPSARGASLGRNLLVSMWVVGRWLGRRYLFGAVGVRDGQVKMGARCGGQTVPAIAPVFVEEYDDELCLMYFDLQHPPAGVAAQLEPVERLLGLSGTGNGASGPERRLFPQLVA